MYYVNEIPHRDRSASLFAGECNNSTPQKCTSLSQWTVQQSCRISNWMSLEMYHISMELHVATCLVHVSSFISSPSGSACWWNKSGLEAVERHWNQSVSEAGNRSKPLTACWQKHAELPLDLDLKGPSSWSLKVISSPHGTFREVKTIKWNPSLVLCMEI